jgi:uncharacterized protein YbbK (DUF523 family)
MDQRLPSQASILASRCLLGTACRFDGQSKPQAALGLLPSSWTLLDLCPEADLGMDTPRPPIGLLVRDGRLHLMECNSPREWTTEMESWCAFLAHVLVADGVAGAVLKARSPSCGKGDVAVYGEHRLMAWPGPAEAALNHVGDGFLVRALKRRDASFPILRDEDLLHEGKRLAFVQAVERRCGLSAPR